MDRFQTDTSLDGRIDLLSVSCHLFFLNAHNPSEESGGTSLGNPDYGNAGQREVLVKNFSIVHWESLFNGSTE
jgi:hypothetical protein